jgi:hypothetical protein
MMKPLARCVLGALLVVPVSLNAGAQEGGQPEIGLELNTLEQTDDGCRLTFVIRNGMAEPIEALSFELALFDSNGTVRSVIALNAGAMPAGKTRVRRFNLRNVVCADVSRLLLNDITECDGGGLSPADCLRRLKASSRTDADFSL